MNPKIILFSFLILIMIGCEEELCRNCNTYDLQNFQGELNNFYSSFFVCEHDAMWDDIAWLEDCDGCILANEGGVESLIDSDIYKIGVRHIENTDIDGDNIDNDFDSDIDNDGILNYEDSTPYGTGSQTILELVICTEN